MAEIQDLLALDASNIARWPENMPFSGVNDAGRADEGLMARWYQDTNASITASGSTNAFAITSNRVIASLFNNCLMAFTANFSITGATTLNLNGLGAKNLKRFNGDPLAQGDIISGQPILALYKSASDQWFMLSALAANTANMFFDLNENATPGTPSADTARVSAFDDSGVTRLRFTDGSGNVTVFSYPAATAAEMEAATATNRFVTPGLQHRHPGHPKAWASVVGTATPASLSTPDYGVASLTDNGTGDYLYTYDTAFNGAYSVVGTVSETNTVGNSTFEIFLQTTTTTEAMTHYATSGGSRVDFALICMAAFGDQ